MFFQSMEYSQRCLIIIQVIDMEAQVADAVAARVGGTEAQQNSESPVGISNILSSIREMGEDAEIVQRPEHGAAFRFR